MELVSLNLMPLVRINAPDWYKRADWLKWLSTHTPQCHPATWYRGGEPDEMSDVFFTYGGDSDGGSDYPGTEDNPGIPDDIWQEIMSMIPKEEECLIWVSNLEI